VTDAQLQAELDHFVAGRGLPADLAHEYFLLTPPSVVVCIDGSGTECSVNATRGQEFCAYHSETAGGHVYAVIPDFVGLGGCDPFVTECPATACAYDNSPADAVLSAVSHEHNESITDPEPNTGWTDWQICGSSSPMTCGGEIGDKCNGDAFADPNIQYQPDGSGNDTPYNETINGRHYLLQREWSNQSRQCLDSFAPSANVASATLTDSSVSGYTVAFNAAGSAATGGVTEYVWQWDDGPGQTTTQETSSPAIEHTFPAPGSYRVALTVMGPDGTSAGTASTVLITRPPSPVAAFTSSGTLLGQPVTFDGRASSAPAGALTTYTWYFGDGTSANGPTASHIYAAARTYTVTLIVADPFGQTGEVSHLVTITAPPAVTPPICVVPRLRGKTLSAAQHALRAAHCTTGRVSRPRHKPRRRGRWKLVVARASPGSGARELAGSGISLALTYVRG
jgi:PKD repeat protein